MRLAKAGEATNGCVFFALEQTQGKGQRGRKWYSQAGQNIMMSIILTGNVLDLNNPFSISCLIAASAHELLTCSGSDEFCIKWPNDIYWRDRKAGGILIENAIQNGKWKIAVVGIGININQTDFEQHPTKAVSLKQITGKDNDPIDMGRQLCRIVDRRLKHHLESGEFGHDYFNRNLFKRGERAILDLGSGPQEVEIQKVDSKGRLHISTENGEKTLESGNVQWHL